MRPTKLPVTEDLDFHYLLTLLPPLTHVDEYAWLPELFSIIGYQSLLLLCKYAGGETIKIPTLDELTNSMEALNWWYLVNIRKTHTIYQVPSQYRDLYKAIDEQYAKDD